MFTIIAIVLLSRSRPVLLVTCLFLSCAMHHASRAFTSEWFNFFSIKGRRTPLMIFLDWGFTTSQWWGVYCAPVIFTFRQPHACGPFNYGCILLSSFGFSVTFNVLAAQDAALDGSCALVGELNHLQGCASLADNSTRANNQDVVRAMAIPTGCISALSMLAVLALIEKRKAQPLESPTPTCNPALDASTDRC